MEHPASDCCIQPFSTDCHDIQSTVELLIASAPELFSLLFGRSAPKILSQLVVRSHNRFSYRYIRVAVLETEVVGLVTLIPAVDLHEQRDYAEVLSRWALWRVEGVQRLLRDRLLRHDYPKTAAYIGNLAVQPNYRNQGIGTQLLQSCIAEVRQADWSSLFISVDIANLRAQKLYESMGFTLATVHTLSILGMQVGSRVLELPRRYGIRPGKPTPLCE